MAELAKAYVQIIPSADGISGKLTSLLGGEASAAGDSAGSILGNGLVSKIKGIVAAAGIGKAISAALTEGADLQQSTGGIETLFKDSANTVIESAKNAYKTAGMSANEYMETVTSFSASLIQGLSGDTGKAASIADMALTDMSDNANKMGTDMELIQNAYQGFAKQNYTMLDNLKLGYGGTKTEMQRLLEDAQKLSGVEYNIDNLSDVYEAIHVVQDAMGITETTAKEASSTFSGAMTSMKAAAKNVLGNLALGESIGPSLSALGDTVFTFVSGNLMPMVGNILSGLPEVVEGALSIGIRGLNLLGSNADVIVQQGIDLVGGLASGIASALPSLGSAAIDVVMAFGKAIINADWMSIITDAITAFKDDWAMTTGEILGDDDSIVKAILNTITSGLPLILEGGVNIVLEMARGIFQGAPGAILSMGDLLDQLLSAILDLTPSVLQSGIELIGGLAEGLITNLPAIGSATTTVISKMLGTLAESFPDILQQGFELIGGLASGLGSNLPAIAAAVGDVVGDLLYEFAVYLPDLLEQGITMICELAAGLIAAIPEAVAAIPKIIGEMVDKFLEHDWGKLGSDIISGVASGISAGVGDIVDAAKSAAKSALDAAKSWLGIASPSKVMRDQVGKFIPLGVAAGIEQNMDPVTQAMKDIAQTTTGSIEADVAMTAKTNVATVRPSEKTSESAELTVLKEILLLLKEMRGELTEELIEAMARGLKLKINQREFARLVREVEYA